MSLSQIGINIPNIPTLQQLDLVCGAGATALALLMIGIVGVVAVASPGSGTGAGQAAVADFGKVLRTIIDTASGQVLLSLRLVLSPLIWLIPSFSIAAFSRNAVDYLNAAAARPNNTIWDLINPFSATAVVNYGNALVELSLALLSVVAVIVAVALVDHSWRVIHTTIEVFGVAVRTVALTLAFFTFSLAFLNAFLVLIRPHTTEPFQVGGMTLLSLVVAGIFVALAQLNANKPSATQTP